MSFIWAIAFLRSCLDDGCTGTQRVSIQKPCRQPYSSLGWRMPCVPSLCQAPPTLLWICVRTHLGSPFSLGFPIPCAHTCDTAIYGRCSSAASTSVTRLAGSPFSPSIVSNRHTGIPPLRTMDSNFSRRTCRNLQLQSAAWC